VVPWGTAVVFAGYGGLQPNAPPSVEIDSGARAARRALSSSFLRLASILCPVARASAQRLSAKEQPMPATTAKATSPSLTRRMVGVPLTIRGYTIQPIAQLTGRQGGRADATAGGGGAWLRLRPVAIAVRAPDQPSYTLTITDPTTRQLRALVSVALGIAAGALALSFLVRRLLR